MQTKPICKTIAPELYTRHTKHMSRAKKLSYNYANIDDYIVEHFGKRTLDQIALDLNEYRHRIQYRYKVLSDKGIIMGDKKRRKLERQIEAMTDQMVQTYFEVEELKAKLAKMKEVNV